MNHIVLVTDPMAKVGLAPLEAHPDIDLRVRTGLEPADLLREVSEAHALLVRSGTQVTAEVLAAGGHLRVVGRAGTGVDNIDLEAATHRGVVVMNTPGGNSVAACEHTFALLLSLFRNVPLASRELAAGEWTRKKHMGRQLQGRTLGLIGFGRIGREVAARARAFGMTVQVADPFVSETLARENEVALVDRDTVIREADVISLHLPLNDETRHLIDADALAAMKPGAVLVNCARGGLVDEDALYSALENGEMGGAALDVFEGEPPSDTRLAAHPKVVATPHLGASTVEAQLGVAADLAAQVIDYLVGGEVRNAVNVPSLSAEAYAQARPYLDLAERLGAFAGQVAGEAPDKLEVRFRGDARDLPRSPVVIAAVVGALRSLPSGAVANYVNARMLAGERHMEVVEAGLDDAGEETGLLEVAVSGPEGGCVVGGRVTAAGHPRLTRWEGLGVDAPPTGDMLAIRNPDVPGVVGVIGTLLGEAGVNIGHIAWGRNRDANEALVLLNLDTPVSEELRSTLAAHPLVTSVRPVRLP